MTARQVYEGVLIEMNKVQAPSLLLEDFNYLFNKAINQYINKRYNIYDINQQTTDDIRVLKASAVLKPIKSFTSGKGHESGNVGNFPQDGFSGSNNLSPYGTVYDVTGMNSLYGATYEAYLPMDYLHLLSCICNFRVHKTFKCYDKNTFVQFAAQRLTSDAWATIINNFYMRPSYKRPYYYIHNVNTKRDVPTSPNRSTDLFNLKNFKVYDIDGTLLTYDSGGYDNVTALNKLDNYTFNVKSSTIDDEGNVVTNVWVVTNEPLITIAVTDQNKEYAYSSTENPKYQLISELNDSVKVAKEQLNNATEENKDALQEAYNNALEKRARYKGSFYIGSDEQYHSIDAISKVNSLDYVAALREVGVYSTGQDMDSLNSEGKATNGYTYGQYTSTEDKPNGDGYTTTPTGVSNFPRSIIIGDTTGEGGQGSFQRVDVVERPAAMRFGNASQVRLEIRYGKI